MAGIADDLNNIKSIVGGLSGNNKVARFAYTQAAYTNDDAAGRSSFDVNADNNIPTNDASTLDTNPTVIDRGFQTQASSLTRQLQNHFYGRVSYNLNKLVDKMYDTLGTLSAAMGRSDSAAGDKTYIATLDANGRLPSNQLTEDAMEIRTYWDASTNTPDLTAAANKRPGNVYYVSTEGTRDIGGGSKTYYVGDVLICNKSLRWERIPVTYVKGGAENASAYRTGKANITKANVGLGNVADIDQSPGLKDLTFTADASTVTVGGTKLDGNSAALTGSSLPVVSSTQAGVMTAAMYNQLTNMVLDFMFPVGTLYWTKNANFNPNVTFGGTWVRLKDCVIRAAGDNDTVDDTVRGKDAVTASDLPGHQHDADGGAGNKLLFNHTTDSTGYDLTQITEVRAFMDIRHWEDGSEIFDNSNSKGTCLAYYNNNQAYRDDTPTITSWAGYAFGGHATSGGGSTTAGENDDSSDSTKCDKMDFYLPHRHYFSVVGTISGKTASNNSGVTTMDIKNKYLARYCWERLPDPTPAT